MERITPSERWSESGSITLEILANTFKILYALKTLFALEVYPMSNVHQNHFLMVVEGHQSWLQFFLGGILMSQKIIKWYGLEHPMNRNLFTMPRISFQWLTMRENIRSHPIVILFSLHWKKSKWFVIDWSFFWWLWYHCWYYWYYEWFNWLDNHLIRYKSMF